MIKIVLLSFYGLGSVVVVSFFIVVTIICVLCLVQVFLCVYYLVSFLLLCQPKVTVTSFFLLQSYLFKPNALLSSADRQSINIPHFFLLNFFKNSHVAHIKLYIFFKDISSLNINRNCLGQFREIPWNQTTDVHRGSTLITRVITCH